MYLYSQLQLSLELRNCFQSVRTSPLILANSYRITSILHMVLSAVTVSVFIEICLAQFNFWSLGRGSKWGHLGVVQNEFLLTWSCYISSESIFDADFEFWICLAQFNFWARGWGQVGFVQNEFLQTWSSESIFWCGFWISNLFGSILIFGPGEFLFYFWARGRGQSQILQNESLQTWWCYNAWNWSWARCDEHVDNFLHL